MLINSFIFFLKAHSLILNEAVIWFQENDDYDEGV